MFWSLVKIFCSLFFIISESCSGVEVIKHKANTELLVMNELNFKRSLELQE